MEREGEIENEFGAGYQEEYEDDPACQEKR